MSEFWDKFLFHFCKVGFVCYHGEPNWLGWIFIGIAGILILWLSLIILVILTAIFDG